MNARYLVDTNILLRFLSGEPAGQAKAAKRLFASAAAGDVLLDVSPVVVAETIYTLQSYYEVDRKEAATQLLALLKLHGVKVGESARVFDALTRLRTSNVGFADAYLASASAAEGVPIASFDRDFDRFKDVVRYEPKE